MKKILIADEVSKDLVSSLEVLGAEVMMHPELTAETLPEAIADAGILIVRSTKVTADTIKVAKHLGLIVRAGAGVNTIDLEAASGKGIYVTNCPGMNTDAVAEVTIGLLISADRGIADATQAMRDGKWQKGRFGKAKGLKGRTLGIIGMGQIGQAVAKRAKALDMKIIAWSRSLSPEKAEALGLDYAATLTELAAKSDAVSVHIAAVKETIKLINNEFLKAMKPGAIFLNTSRGDVVDTEALAEVIRVKGIRVGLDVFEGEPEGNEASFDQTALAVQTVCTPHIGASTEQAEEAIASEVLRIVRQYMQTGQPLNAVNLRKSMDKRPYLTIRHYNHVGVLARVLDMLRDERINVEEMQNTIFKTNEAACCCLTLDKTPNEITISKLTNDQDILEVSMV
jgi:D-3-phosphoglycerate dehydrogenase / 2-oxoglutarate reductase